MNQHHDNAQTTFPMSSGSGRERLSLSKPRRNKPQRGNGGGKPKRQAPQQPRKLKGHELMLDELKKSGEPVDVFLVSDGTFEDVKVVDSDKYTVTIEIKGNKHVCLFKHAIGGIVAAVKKEAATDD